jgi:hypothetical protein
MSPFFEPVTVLIFGPSSAFLRARSRQCNLSTIGTLLYGVLVREIKRWAHRRAYKVDFPPLTSCTRLSSHCQHRELRRIFNGEMILRTLVFERLIADVGAWHAATNLDAESVGIRASAPRLQSTSAEELLLDEFSPLRPRESRLQHRQSTATSWIDPYESYPWVCAALDCFGIITPYRS